MKLLRCNGRVLKIREVGEVVCRMSASQGPTVQALHPSGQCRRLPAPPFTERSRHQSMTITS